jgi:hypothetical protein
MTLRIPNEGENRLLGMQLGKYAAEVFVLKLYSSNTTPSENDSGTTYTELAGNGYAAINLTAANWTITEGAPTEAVYPQQTWTFTGAAGNVYGYYIVGATSGKVLWAERFADGPYNIALAGDAIKVTPKFTLQDTLD